MLSVDALMWLHWVAAAVEKRTCLHDGVGQPLDELTDDEHPEEGRQREDDVGGAKQHQGAAQEHLVQPGEPAAATGGRKLIH